MALDEGENVGCWGRADTEQCPGSMQWPRVGKDWMRDQFSTSRV